MHIKNKLLKIKDSELVRYIAVGIISLLLDIFITSATYEVTKMINVSILLGYLSSVLFGFYGHKRITFSNGKNNTFYKYILSVLIVYLLNYYSVVIVKNFFFFNNLFYPKIFTTPLITLSSFLLLKYFVFKK